MSNTFGEIAGGIGDNKRPVSPSPLPSNLVSSTLFGLRRRGEGEKGEGGGEVMFGFVVLGGSEGG